MKVVLTVDDGGHGEDDTVAVVDDGVQRLVFDDVEVMSQVAVCLQESGDKKEFKNHL